MKPRVRWVCGLAAAVLLSLSSGCSKEARIAKHRERAEESYRSGEFEAAIIHGLNVLRLTSSDAPTLRILGLAHSQSGHPVQAFPFLRRAAELLPDDVEVRTKLASIYLLMGDYNQVRTNAGAVLDRQPTDLAALKLWCGAASTVGEVDEALKRLEGVADKISDQAALQLMRGRLHLVHKDLNSAERAFQEAAALAPESTEAQLVLGELYLKEGNTNLAGNAFQKAAQQGTNSLHGSFRWAEFKRETGDLAESKRLLEELVQANPEYSAAAYRLAQIEVTEGRTNAAMERVQAIVKRDPTFLPAIALETRLQWMTGDVNGAVATLKQQLARYPRFAPFHFNLGLIHARGADPASAVEPLEKALSLVPSDSDARLLLAEVRLRTRQPKLAVETLEGLPAGSTNSARATFLLGQAYTAQRRLPEAVSAFALLTTLVPEAAQSHLLYGLSLALAERLPEARAALEKALALNPRSAQSLRLLADVIRQEGSVTNAIARVEKQLEQIPDEANAWVLLGNLRLGGGNSTGAESAYRRAIGIQPKSVAAHQMLAQLCAGTGRVEEAVRLIEYFLNLNPDDFGSQTLAGSLYQNRLGAPKKAQQAYEAALKLQPNAPAVANNLAVMYAESDPERAFALAQQASRGAPESPEIKDTLGWITCQRGDPVTGLVHLQDAAKQRPSSGEIQFHLGMALGWVGREQEASETLRQSLRLSPEFTGRSTAANLVRLLSLPVETVDAGQLESIRKDAADLADHPSMAIRMARLEERQGDRLRAVARLTPLVQKHPAFFPAAVDLARLYSLTAEGRPKALELLKKTYQQLPNEPTVAMALAEALLAADDAKWAFSVLDRWRNDRAGDPAFLFTLAQASFASGDARRSREHAEAALRTSTDFPAAAQVRTFLEMVALGEKPKGDTGSLGRIQQVLAADPENLPAQLALIAHYEKSNRPEKVIPLCETLLARHPRFQSASLKLGEALYAHGFSLALLEPASARTALNRALTLNARSTNAPQAQRVLASLPTSDLPPPEP